MSEVSPDPRSRKGALLELMERAHERRMAWMVALTGQARAAEPAEGHWGAKASVAHMARWNLALLTALKLKASGEVVPYQWRDLDAENDRVLLESAGRTWDEISTEAEASYAALRSWAERLSEEELAAADDFAWQEGWPLWQTFLGNVYFHYLAHLAEWFEGAGEAEEATALRTEMNRVDRALDRR